MSNFREDFAKARIGLLKEFPFFGCLSMYLRLVESRTVPTTAVDIHGNFYYNAEYVKKLSVSDLRFEVGHEVGHLFTRTIEKKPKGAFHPIWNKAADIVIDILLRDSGLPPSWVTEECTTEENIEQYRGWTTLKVYQDLIKDVKILKIIACPDCSGDGKPGDSDKKSQGGSGEGEEEGQCPTCGGKDGQGTDDARNCISGSMLGDQGDKKEITEWKQRAIGAAESAKSRGKLPGSLQEWLAELLEPKIHWTDYLRVTASRTMKRNWTWKVPGRRGEGLGIRLPGRNPKLPTAVIAMDTSGSISDEELVKFVSESAEILRLTGGKVRVILFDAEVYSDKEVADFSMDMDKVQRGGTDFQTVFHHLEDKKPNLLVFFTDLFAPYPEEHPGYPIVWAVTPNHCEEPVPFGETVVVED